MFTIHQKRFSFLKHTFISFFTNGANRPGVNRPVRKMVLERIVPGGTGFGANRPITDEMSHQCAQCHMTDFVTVWFIFLFEALSCPSLLVCLIFSAQQWPFYNHFKVFNCLTTSLFFELVRFFLFYLFLYSVAVLHSFTALLDGCLC